MAREEFVEVPDESDLPVMIQAEVAALAASHQDFLKGQGGGRRAILKFKDLSGLDFSGYDLSQADFTGSRLAGTDLSECQLEGVSFFACDMRNCNLFHANLTRADLRGAYLSGANMTTANLTRADLRAGKIMKRGKNGVLEDRKRLTLSGTRTVLSGARLKNANLQNVDARGADLSDADLTSAIIRGAEFEEASLLNANLSRSDLSNSNFSKANLNGTITANSTANNTEFFGAKRDNIKGSANMGLSIESLGKSLEELLEDHHLWVSTAGEKAQRLDLSGFDLREIENLYSYELTAIKAMGASFIGQNLKDIHLQHALLDKSDFRDCDMQRGDFRASHLKYALFSRADLRRANFRPLYFSNADGSKRQAVSDLTGANFRYADLRGVDFSHAILKGADFSHALLEDTLFEQANLSGALLKGTLLEKMRLRD